MNSSFTPANRPLPRPGERHSEMVPSFSAGSVRRYVSVVWSVWCPSHSETLRMSPVASRMFRAQACRLSRATFCLGLLSGGHGKPLNPCGIQTACTRFVRHEPVPFNCLHRNAQELFRTAQDFPENSGKPELSYPHPLPQSGVARACRGHPATKTRTACLRGSGTGGRTMLATGPTIQGTSSPARLAKPCHERTADAVRTRTSFPQKRAQTCPQPFFPSLLNAEFASSLFARKGLAHLETGSPDRREDPVGGPDTPAGPWLAVSHVDERHDIRLQFGDREVPAPQQPHPCRFREPEMKHVEP